MKNYIHNYGAFTIAVTTVIAIGVLIVYNMVTYGYHNPIAS